MEAVGVSLAILLGIILAAFLYEGGRRFYYWFGARILGWSEQEKFERETAWIDGSVKRDQRQAGLDAHAMANSERRRFGVWICAATVAVLAAQINMAWWEVALIFTAVYAGLTMAAGLAWKWW